MTKPKRKTPTEVVVECISHLTDAVKAQNKADREYLVAIITSNAQHQAEQERTRTYRGTGPAHKWEAEALNIFYKDGWYDKVDEDVAEYAFREWEASSSRANLFVLKSDEERVAYFEKLKEKIEAEGRELGEEGVE